MYMRQVGKSNLEVLVLASFVILAYSMTLPQIERYRGWKVFTVIFKSHDNTSAITEYAKPKYANDIIVMKIDYLRGAAEVAVSPKAYNEVRTEFESGDLDNFNIIDMDMAESMKQNMGLATP